MAKSRKGIGGRKNKYFSHVKPRFDEIREWCKTMTDNQIAEKLNIGWSSFARYKQEHQELRDVLKNGRLDLVTNLRSSLIKKAHGYDYEEQKVVTESVHWDEDMYRALIDAGFTPAQIASSRLVKTEVTRKHMAPDVAALNLALKNYDRENWANDPQSLEIKKKELELRKQQIENASW